MQPNKHDIVKTTLAHPLVQDQIDMQVKNWIQRKRRLAPTVRRVLTEIARRVTERIVDNPPPSPDFSTDWREKIVNHAYNALPYPAFEKEIIPETAAGVRSILPHINEESLRNDIYNITIMRIAQYAGSVAGMIYHQLDPDLIRATEEEIAIEQLRLAQMIAEDHPEKVIVMPDDVEPIDIILEIQKRIGEQEERDGEDEDA